MSTETEPVAADERVRRDRVSKVTLSDAEMAEIRAAADAEGLDLASYLRRCALMAARAERGAAR
jgi:hypothetical protein